MEFPDLTGAVDAVQSRFDPWWPFLWSAGVAIAVGAAAYWIALWAIRRTIARKPGPRAFLERARAPVRLIIPLVLVLSAAAAMPAQSALAGTIRHWLIVALIALFGWLGMRLADGFQRAVDLRWPVDVVDNLQARAIRTQSLVLMRTIKTLVLLITLAAVLTTFPSIRQIGASLLASAGLAGLVVGFAARPMLGNLIAGLQIAITQPIRIDDVLIVQGEWGRVEKIGGTYVVIRIWDDRRLIVPLQWFIENPFENWTRRSAELLGTVTLWVDYRLPLAPLREELDRLCRADPDWDGRVSILQVVESGPQAMQLRALVSAANSGKAWDLRCRVREGLIAFIGNQHPECLPRLRAEVDGGTAPADRDAGALPDEGDGTDRTDAGGQPPRR